MRQNQANTVYDNIKIEKTFVTINTIILRDTSDEAISFLFLLDSVNLIFSRRILQHVNGVITSQGLILHHINNGCRYYTTASMHNWDRNSAQINVGAPKII